MDYFCQYCDRLLIENPDENENYLTTSSRKIDKNLFIKYTINNISLDELDKTLEDYISTQSKKFVFYLIICELIIEFENKFTGIIKTDYYYNTDIINIKRGLIDNIYRFLPKIFKDCHAYNIKQANLKTINDRCNMTLEFYKNMPMSMIERRLNFIIAKNPSLIKSLNQTTNHRLIRKYSHITFNN